MQQGKYKRLNLPKRQPTFTPNFTSAILFTSECLCMHYNHLFSIKFCISVKHAFGRNKIWRKRFISVKWYTLDFTFLQNVDLWPASPHEWQTMNCFFCCSFGSGSGISKQGLKNRAHAKIVGVQVVNYHVLQLWQN